MEKTLVRLKVLSTAMLPEEITARLGLECHRSWRVGDLRAHTIIREKVNAWILESGLPESAELDEHVDAVVRMVEPHREAFRALEGSAEVELSCVIYAKRAPALNFDRDLVLALAQMGASLDIDLYLI